MTPELGGIVSITIRAPFDDELPALASLWHEGWHEGHASIVSPALTRLRTLDDFSARLKRLLPYVRVSGKVGTPTGFCVVKGDELHQMYVARSVRGQGVAAALMVDGEQRLRLAGHELGWLACAIGNDRAAHFYQKCGWACRGEITLGSETSAGDFPVKVWRYEKRIAV